MAGLIVRGNRTMIANIGDDQTVRLRPVTVAGTDGVMTALSSGASVGERVAINLPDDIEDGARVRLPTATATAIR